MITTVIFDLDDTLYDELEYCKSGFAAVSEFVAEGRYLSAKITAEAVFESLWKQFAAGNYTQTFNAAFDDIGVDYDGEMIRNLISIYRQHTPAITLPAESGRILDLLSSEYTLALLTDGFLPAQQLKVKALGIEGYFECIVYTEELGREFWKPSPEGFKVILKKLKAKPQNCVYVADNPKKDFIAPNVLGIKTIQVVRPRRVHTTGPSEPNAAPGQIIGTLMQLSAAIKRL